MNILELGAPKNDLAAAQSIWMLRKHSGRATKSATTDWDKGIVTLVKNHLKHFSPFQIQRRLWPLQRQQPQPPQPAIIAKGLLEKSFNATFLPIQHIPPAIAIQDASPWIYTVIGAKRIP